jgi:hypothetical protein
VWTKVYIYVFMIRKTLIVRKETNSKRLQLSPVKSSFELPRAWYICFNLIGLGVVVFNTAFNNISAIS